MKKLFVFILMVGVLGGTGWWWWQRGKTEEVSYQTSPVKRGDITQVVTATGTLNPGLNVQVGSQISGNIRKLMADFNSTVKAGQVVAEIDPSIYKAAVMQAEGDLANAAAGLELARLNAKRTEDLRKENVTPQSNLDQAVATLHQSEAMVKMKDGALAKAKTDLEHCTIYSPIDGIVISRLVDVGQTVAAAMNAPIMFQIANDLGKMQIDTNVAEADIGNVVVGQDVDFTVDAYPYQMFHGKVTVIRNAPITVQNVVTYDTVISVNNDELKLKPGMTANVSIIVAKRANVLKLSNATLRFKPQDAISIQALVVAGATKSKSAEKRGARSDVPRMERTVYVLKGEEPDAHPEPMKIRTGISDGIFSEVIEGLQEYDPVIIAQSAGQPAANGGSSSPFTRRF